MTKTIKLVVFPVGKEPEVREIPDGLKPLQDVVGGYIDIRHIDPLGLDLLVNDEGLINGMPLNRIDPYLGQPLAGDFAVIGHTPGGNTRSLTDKEIERAIDFYRGSEWAPVNLTELSDGTTLQLFKFPIYVTPKVWVLVERAVETGSDVKGVVWDIAWMAYMGAKMGGFKQGVNHFGILFADPDREEPQEYELAIAAFGFPGMEPMLLVGYPDELERL